MTSGPNQWTFSIGWKASSEKITKSKVNHNKAWMITERYGINFGTSPQSSKVHPRNNALA